MRLKIGVGINLNTLKMKKVKALMLILILSNLSISCEENSTISDFEQNNALVNDEILRKEKIENYKKIGTVVLRTISNNESFKELVYQECLKQKYGDYDIKLKDLLVLNERELFWDDKTIEEIETYVHNLEKLTPYETIIFIPFTESLDEEIIQNTVTNFQKSMNPADTKIVFKDEYDSTNLTCPGYSLIDDDLNYDGDVDEDYAWENDIWVIGPAEFNNGTVPELTNEDPNTTDGGSIPTTNISRVEGRAEYGGIIQITDRGAVEPWISGKFEMKYIVFSAAGTKIKEKSFGKTRRKHFKDNKWVDYNDFIANWNTSNLGNFMIEAWIEEDGGGSTTVSQTFPSSNGGPSTTITYNLGERDDDLGQAIVQFSDNVNQVYGISYSNFKRK